MPDEILEDVALIFGKKKEFGLLDDFTDVCDQFLTLCKTLAGENSGG